MRYHSTRGQAPAVTAGEAILRGLAPDGGLYLPETLPTLSVETLKAWRTLNYPALAAEVLALFLTDYDPAFLRAAAQAAYGPAFGGKAGQLEKVHDGLYSLELWHGPTCAFKDYALQLMPRLLVQAKAQLYRGETTRILVATSGDTGKAALAGYAGLPGIDIAVFYPNAGTSEIQRLQMATQPGENVAVYAVEGNFDEAQTGVKRVFADAAVAAELEARGIRLSSANSINWGRLAPQIVYYVASYLSLVEKGEVRPGEEVNVVVPTGNFGNILAAYYAGQMGIPFGRMICASNRNNVLTDFLETGVYDRNRAFYTTTSPSMDILISSNLERLLYGLSGRDDAAVRQWFSALAAEGRYQVGDEVKKALKEDFWGGFCGDEATRETIGRTFETYGYVCDPHTAVAVKVYEDYLRATGDRRKTIIASTASPYKFGASVLAAITSEPVPASPFEQAALLQRLTGLPAPASLMALQSKEIRFKGSIKKDEMVEAVKGMLG